MKVKVRHTTAYEKYREHKKSYLIQTGSVRKMMICDCIETGLRLNQTSLLLNKELRRDSLTEIGVLCLINSYLLLNPMTVKIRKVLMGTNNSYSPWEKSSI